MDERRGNTPAFLSLPGVVACRYTRLAWRAPRLLLHTACLYRHCGRYAAPSARYRLRNMPTLSVRFGLVCCGDGAYGCWRGDFLALLLCRSYLVPSFKRSGLNKTTVAFMPSARHFYILHATHINSTALRTLPLVSGRTTYVAEHIVIYQRLRGERMFTRLACIDSLGGG